MTTSLFMSFPKRTSRVIINHVQRRNMPVNVPPTATGKRRFRLAVETDPHKLVNFCCGLNYKKDQQMIPVKPESEYPDWLWELRLGPKPNSWEMEKGTKEYYLRLAEEEVDRNYLLRMRADKARKVVGKTLKDNAEYLHRLRFAALAFMEDDAGLEATSMEQDWWGSQNSPITMVPKVREYYLPKNENKVLYKDKIEGNCNIKNWYDNEFSSFGHARNFRNIPSQNKKAFQDSKRRHRYAST